MIYPRLDGVRFLESFGPKEDSDAPPLSSRGSFFQVIELARSGTKVTQLAETFGMSDATIYNWLKQDGVDRGEILGQRIEVMKRDRALPADEGTSLLPAVRDRDEVGWGSELEVEVEVQPLAHWAVRSKLTSRRISALYSE